MYEEKFDVKKEEEDPKSTSLDTTEETKEDIPSQWVEEEDKDGDDSMEEVSITKPAEEME